MKLLLVVVRCSKTTDRIIRTLLKVKCQDFGKGCDWVGTISDYEVHENLCLFKAVRCHFVGCHFNMPRKDLKQHETQCLHRTSECKKAIENDMLIEKNEEETVQCKYNFIGCGATVIPNDLHQHMEDSTHQHMAMLLEYTSMIATKLQSTTNMLDFTTSKLSSVEMELSDLKDKINVSKSNLEGGATEMCKDHSSAELIDSKQIVKLEEAPLGIILEPDYCHDLKNDLKSFKEELECLKDEVTQTKADIVKTKEAFKANIAETNTSFMEAQNKVLEKQMNLKRSVQTTTRRLEELDQDFRVHISEQNISNEDIKDKLINTAKHSLFATKLLTRNSQRNNLSFEKLVSTLNNADYKSKMEQISGDFELNMSEMSGITLSTSTYGISYKHVDLLKAIFCDLHSSYSGRFKELVNLMDENKYYPYTSAKDSCAAITLIKVNVSRFMKDKLTVAITEKEGSKAVLQFKPPGSFLVKNKDCGTLHLFHEHLTNRNSKVFILHPNSDDERTEITFDSPGVAVRKFRFQDEVYILLQLQKKQ